MRFRITLLAAMAGGLLAVALAPAGVASAAKPGPAGGGLVAGAGVITVGNPLAASGRAAGGASTQAVPPSFCYVRVSQPQLGAGLILSGTWQVDCRSGAN